MAIDFIPEKFYVTRQPRNAHTPDEILGFMQPMQNAGFKQRKESADKWAGRNALDPIEVDNKPLSGFSMTENKRRYMNKNVVWRVLHPLGFEFEISSDNFSDFLMEIDMKQGIIQTPMLFVRRNGENYLTYEGSNVHANAVSQTQMEKKVSTKDIKPGDVVTLKNGRTGQVYLGAWHTLELPETKYNAKALVELDASKIKSKRHHYFTHIDCDINGKDETLGRYVSSYSSLSVNSIDEQGRFTEAACEQACADYYKQLTYSKPLATDKKAMAMSKMKSVLTELPLLNQTKGTLVSTQYGISYDATLLVELTDGTQWLYHYGQSGYYGHQTDVHTLYNTNKTEISDNTFMYTYAERMTRRHGRDRPERIQHKQVERDEIAKVYRVSYERA